MLQKLKVSTAKKKILLGGRKKRAGNIVRRKEKSGKYCHVGKKIAGNIVRGKEMTRGEIIGMGGKDCLLL